MAIKILKNDADDAFLEKEGYIVVPFLDAEAVSRLLQLYYDNHKETKEGLYATAHSSDYDFKKGLSDAILKEFNPPIADIFFECRALGGSYIAKYKGEKGVLYPHQDWNIVDEDIFRSFNIWVPLVDTNLNNGGIAVLPGSHKFVKSYRGVNIPDPFMHVNGHTWQYHKNLDIKAGQALIYDHRLLHASAVNQTDVPRVAVVFGIIPSAAQMRLYYMENEVVGEYENEVDFFFKKDILKGPQGLKKLRDLDYSVPFVTEQQFDAMVKPPAIEAINQPAVRQSFFQKLLRAIGA